MLKILIVGLGGFIGAVGRYELSGLVQRRFGDSFPLGTLAVNVLGCLLAGIVIALLEQREWFSPNTRLFIMIGILGSLTTFSTFGYETINLLKQGHWNLGLLNVAGSVVLGLLAVALGMAAVKAFGA